jgi:hypothetical protein
MGLRRITFHENNERSQVIDFSCADPPFSWQVLPHGLAASGTTPLPAEVRNAGSPGHVCSLWLTDGSLDRAHSILIPRIASPPVIRDKNRMR